MTPSRARSLFLALLVCAAAWLSPVSGGAEQASGTAEYGIAVKRPVVGGACKYCPWGALADIVKKAMAPYGYDVAVCYSCSGADSIRYVADRLMAPEITERQRAEGTTFRPGAAPDFGINQSIRIAWAYQGLKTFAKDGPRRNLRIIARIEQPSYVFVAPLRSLGIRNLKDIAARNMPVRIMRNGSEAVDAVLEYYGLTQKNVESWGGKFLNGTDLERTQDFDVLIGIGVLGNYPEGNVWYEMSMKKDLVFLPLPEDLRQTLVKDYEGVLVEIPWRYLRGVDDDPVPTVGFSGHSVFGLASMPDQFAYDVARALDEQRALFRWGNLPFSYDRNTAWKGSGVPLHPGAARYYREAGYMK